MADDDGEKEQPIVIKKINKGGHGHHGGAWKVAYADFVTAMMAFFLLMWLLNATTEEQKTGIADYFAPSTDPMSPRVSVTTSGAEGVLQGLAVAVDGAMVTTTQPLVNTPEELTNVDLETINSEGFEEAEQQAQIEEQELFDSVEAEIQQALQSDPELAELSPNLVIDETPEGLRIQIVDQEGQSMFPSGSSRMYEKMQKLLNKLAGIISKAPNEISVRGHTDSIPYKGRGGKTNWELSAERANSSRKVLLDSGLQPKKIHDVVGKADTDHLFPNEPNSPRNRRISIILLKDAIVDAKRAPTRGGTRDSRDYLKKLQTPTRSNSIIDFE